MVVGQPYLLCVHAAGLSVVDLDIFGFIIFGLCGGSACKKSLEECTNRRDAGDQEFPEILEQPAFGGYCSRTTDNQCTQTVFSDLVSSDECSIIVIRSV